MTVTCTGSSGARVGQAVPAQQRDQPALHARSRTGSGAWSRSAAAPAGRRRSTASSSRSRVSSRVSSRVRLAGRRSAGAARVPRAEVQRVQLGQRPGADPAAAVAGAVQPAVVHADQVPVAGQPDVALQAVGALVEGAQVRGEGVLGQRVRGAAVGEDQRRRPMPAASDDLGRAARPR